MSHNNKKTSKEEIWTKIKKLPYATNEQIIEKMEYDINFQMSENEASKTIAELKAENERLKEENFNFKEIVKLRRREQYEQALQKIKRVATALYMNNEFPNE